MSGHTPGPWIINGRTIKRTGTHSSDQDDICYINEEGGNESSRWFADTDVVNADANLIASAPDLYEAAKLAFKYFPGPGNDEVEIVLRRAILKAEGREVKK